jgi:hypothetical protein
MPKHPLKFISYALFLMVGIAPSSYATFLCDFSRLTTLEKRSLPRRAPSVLTPEQTALAADDVRTALKLAQKYFGKTPGGPVEVRPFVEAMEKYLKTRMQEIQDPTPLRPKAMDSQAENIALEVHQNLKHYLDLLLSAETDGVDTALSQWIVRTQPSFEQIEAMHFEFIAAMGSQLLPTRR